MKRRRWAFGAVVVAGVVALVAPAVGQGKAGSASLGWSLSRGGVGVTSYDFGALDGGSSVSRWYRLGNSTLAKSGRLKIKLIGSPAFSITSDHCTTKSIGKKLSCWVSVAYAPRGAPATDRARLRATGEFGEAASLSLSGSNLGPSGHVYWDSSDSRALNVVPRGGGSATSFTPGETFPYGGGSWVVHGTNVYWADPDDGTVNEAPLGGGSVTTLASGQSAGALAVDDANVYWFSGGGVNEVPIGGGEVTTLASGQSGTALAVDGTHVYWIDPLEGTVNEVPVAGGQVTTLASDQADPIAVAVDGKNVYWIDHVPGFGSGTVNKVPIGGGSVTTLASGQDQPQSLAADGTHVYWVNNLPRWRGTVNKVSVGGGDVITLASGQSNPTTLAVDSTHVYWANAADFTVNKVRLGGGEVIALAAGPSPPLPAYPYSVALGP